MRSDSILHSAIRHFDNPLERNNEVRTMRTMALGLAAVIAVSVAGCENNQQTGALVGAGTGALLGAAFGAIVGSEIGRRLDERDRAMYAQTATYAAESGPVGQGQTWSNPQSGNRGTITPTSQPYAGNDGRQCRNFSETITLKDGKT